MEYLSTTVTIALAALTVFYFLTMRKKFKKAVYNISTCSQTRDKEFYLVVEMKHGQYIDTRKLSYLELLFIPNGITSLLKQTYNDYDTALLSLREVKYKSVHN